MGDIGFFGTYISLDIKINNIVNTILFGSIYISSNCREIHEGLSKILFTTRRFDTFIISGDQN